MLKKKYIPWLIAMMSVVLLGIILIQLLWLRNAVEVRKEQFSQDIREAMQRVVRRLERRNALMFWGGGYTMRQYYGTQPGQPQSGQTPQSQGGKVNIDLQLDINGHKVQKQVAVDSQKISQLLRGGVPELTAYTDSLLATLDPADTQTHAFMNQQVEWFNRSLEQMRYEFRYQENPLRHRLQIGILPQLLARELEDQGIEEPYEFAITQGDSLLPYRSQGYIQAYVKNSHQVDLFPNDYQRKTYRLNIAFPERRQSLVGSLLWLLVGSGVFTLGILAAFLVMIGVIVRQKNLSEMKTDFINNMTHEFKTPIATISLAADTLRNPKILDKPDKIGYFITKIKEENSRMHKQVERILQMSILEKKDFQLKRQYVDMHELIQHAGESFSLQVQKREGNISLSLNAGNHAIHGDEVHLSNVLYNLLDNANKYTQEAPQISISTYSQQEGLIIEVTDNGPGLSQDMQQKIFERFYRAPTGNVHNVKGFGIGLSYVKAIVEAHGGHIRVKSKPGKGSTFIIFVPYKPPA